MIVVDLGCKSYERETSVEKLVGRFQPELLFGFDPSPQLEEGLSLVPFWRLGRFEWTVVVTRRLAAWTYAGQIRYTHDGTRSRIDSKSDEVVPCFDFLGWLEALPPVELVVKLDIEGAEHPLLAEVVRRGLDARISLALVEWHTAGRIPLSCPVEDWS